MQGQAVSGHCLPSLLRLNTSHVNTTRRAKSFRIRSTSQTSVVVDELSSDSTNSATGPPSTSQPQNPPLPKREAAGEWFFTETGQKTWVQAMQLDTLTPELPRLFAEMGVKYEPERLAEALSSRPTQLTGRAVSVAVSLGGFLTAILRDAATGSLESNAPKRAKQLCNVFSGLGPSFIKVGQALSSRPDLLPKTYLDALSNLQDRLPTFPSSIAYALIEEELGRPVNEVFSELSLEPVAAASLGQVYKGKLRSTGEEVAVKVQRPGISESIAVDMVLLRRLVRVVDENVPQLSQPLVPLVDEFAARLFAELDYVQEGKNAERFEKLYGHVPKVRVPKIIWEGTARRVITMEWINGIKLTDTARMNEAGLDIIDFVTIGVECTLRQLLEAGFFHADPHPGNLLATSAGDLVYLDFGMMSEAPPSARYAIIAHVVHLVNRDYLAMCYDYYTLDFMDPSIDTTPIAPALATFFDDVLQNDVSELNFRTIVDGLGGVLFQYPFKVPAYYALILRSLTVLEGLALTADPKYKLLARAYPYMARRLLTDPAPELRTSFEDFILDEGKLRWSRLENLFEQGSLSQDFDPNQLWLLAEWVCSEGGRPVRRPLASELVKLVDAVAADSVRKQVGERLNSPELASRMIPLANDETLSSKRAGLLWTALTTRAGMTEGVPMPELKAGPFGFPGPGEIQQYVNDFNTAISGSVPRLREVLAKPGAQQLLVDVYFGLMQRIAARGVKLVTGWLEKPGTSGAGKLTTSQRLADV